MRSLREVAAQPLGWSQPSLLKRQYELRAGDEVIATLRQKGFGSLALAETAGGSWTLKRSGFLRPKVSVRSESETEMAVFKPAWCGTGTLRLADGACYHWQNTSFWRSAWAFADEAGNPLVHFKPEAALWKRSAEMKVEAGARALPDLSLLAVLGWYLMILASDDAAVVAAVS